MKYYCAIDWKQTQHKVNCYFAYCINILNLYTLVYSLNVASSHWCQIFTMLFVCKLHFLWKSPKSLMILKHMVNYTRHYLIKWNEIYVMVINFISPWMLSKIATEGKVHIYFATFNHMSAISCLDILNVSQK